MARTRADLAKRALQKLSIDDALEEFLAEHGARDVVGIMGGHGTSRRDPYYRKVVLLAWELTRDGYLIASGGGPGIMEAANLGAWLACYSDPSVIDEALSMLTSAPVFSGGEAEGTPEYLQAIGARSILVRSDIDLGKRPLEKAQWAGAIDNLGGDILTWLTRTVDYGGNIASIGLAASPALNTTVLPFILRAVCLLGINSADTPRDLRLAAWSRIGNDLRPRHLDTIGHRTIPFDELPDAFQAYVDGTVTGRTVVEIS